MTKINKMVLNGFKSFAKHTELVFGDGFNCVIGPNGSGKSNILDALCFVLGRMSAKSMRAEKTANLIYNGGKKKDPAKQGEVSLFFDNANKTFLMDSPEVKITRIIKRDGQSSYLINDEKRTRQEIIDLMNVARIDSNGFNIVLQGDIVRFTEMHPEERRQIIEEISGISVYEEKKAKALRELEKVEERLKEASIILTERNAYLKELKDERDQALKFKDVQDKIKEGKASYVYIQIENNEKEREKYETQVKAHKDKLDKINSEIDTLKGKIAEKKKAIDSINHEIEEKGDKGLSDIQKDIENSKIGIATNKQRKDNVRSEVEKIQLRKQQLEKELEENKARVENLEKQRKDHTESIKRKLEESKKLEKHIDKFRQDNSINNAAGIEKEIDELDKQTETKQKEIEQIRQQQQDLIRKKDSCEYQLSTLEQQIEKISSLEHEHAEQLAGLKKMKENFKTVTAELNKCLEKDSSYARNIGEIKTTLMQKEQDYAKLKSKQTQILEASRGNIALKNLLDQKKKGVFGTVRDLGSVKQKFSLALEVAAGPRLNSIIVENDKIAADNIKYLREKKLGTLTFIPLNKIKTRDATPELRMLMKKPGVEGLAIELITFDSKYEKAFSYIFGDTLVVNNIDTAREIGIGNARMVSLDGDLAEPSGAMHGGYRQRKEGMGFNEDEVIRGIDLLEKSLSEANAELSSLQKKRAENEESIDSLRKKRADFEGEIIKTEKSLHLESGDLDSSQQKRKSVQEEIDKVATQLFKVDDDISEVNKAITTIKIKRMQLKESLTKVRDPKVLAELTAFQEKHMSLKQEMLEIEGKSGAINTELNEVRKPELVKIEELFKTLTKDEQKFKEEMTSVTKFIETSEKELAGKESRAKEFYAKYKGLFTEKTKIEDSIGEEEKGVEEFREKGKNEEIQMNQVNMVSIEIKAKLAGLREEYNQYEGVHVDTKKSLEELKKEIEKLERTVIEIGSVNMRALEVYDSVEKEYSSLLGKKEKLSSEKGDVMNMMNEIDLRKKDLFMKAFYAVNAKFQEFFNTLSTKGEASLELENEESPFEAGLDITVRVAGKKFLDLRSLSGGEKTMTALAFIFAIQEFQPHSFYILDEIDAALDKHNAEKLAVLIRRYVQKAQYIVISHNDAVITEADNLYGISMNEHSISNVTTLKI